MINWTSVITIIISCITGISIMIGLFTKIITDRITGAINKFRIDVVNHLDLRLTSVEAKLQDIQAMERRRR